MKTKPYITLLFAALLCVSLAAPSFATSRGARGHGLASGKGVFQGRGACKGNDTVSGTGIVLYRDKDGHLQHKNGTGTVSGHGIAVGRGYGFGTGTVRGRGGRCREG